MNLVTICSSCARSREGSRCDEVQLLVKQEATLVPRGPKGQERHYACRCPVCEQEVAEAPWSVAEWAVAHRSDIARATVLVLVLG